MRSKSASIVSSVHCGLGALSLYVAAALNGSAVACDLKSVLTKVTSAKPSVATNAANAANAASSTAAWSEQEHPAITGYYHVLTLSQGSVIDERFDNWFADHNELFVDETPPVAGNACNGTWIQSGEREYKLLHDTWQFDSTNTIVIAYGVIRDTVTLSKDRQSFSGTETFTVYDLNNNVLSTYGPFDLQGTRLKVDF